MTPPFHVRSALVFAVLLVLYACGSPSSSGDAGAGTDGGALGDGGSGADAGTGVDAGACSGGAATTAGVQCSFSQDVASASTFVGGARSTASWSCTATQRSVTGNGIPEHATGAFPNPNCPNTIGAVNVSASMPLAPTQASAATPAMVIGYALNSVKLDPNTAGTCPDTASGTSSCSLAGGGGSWRIEALGQSSFNFGVDSSNAHVQPSGEYHYHGMPEGLLGTLGKGTAPTLVGFAMDGSPVYARHGYSVASDATSPVRAMKGSYRTKTSPDASRPPTSTFPMGTFQQDWEYVAGLGDLDECNGRFGVTPEFPCGVYHYYITDSYPFIGRCLKGTVANTGGGMMGPRSCTAPGDCTGACPPGSKGCTCSQSPMGMVCVPTCAMTSDCPTGGPMALSCQGGICRP